jgi:hypothetical protein
MFRPIRVDHTNCLQVAIKTHSFRLPYGTTRVLHVQLCSEFTDGNKFSPGIVSGTKRDCTYTTRTVVP